MPLITSSRYSAVAATLALALAVAGTGYAATTLPRHGSAHHHQKPTNTSPTLVISITADGAINGQLYRAPATRTTRIKHPSDGFYVIKTPGIRLQPSDAESCSVVNYLASTATVDAVNHSFTVHVFDASGNPANIAFRCAFWKIPADS